MSSSLLRAGINRFCDDAEQMLGYRPALFWRVTWRFLSPAFIIVSALASRYFDGRSCCAQIIFGFACYDLTGPNMGDYKYPWWSVHVGWGLRMSSILCIPGYALYCLCRTPGTLKQAGSALDCCSRGRNKCCSGCARRSTCRRTSSTVTRRAAARSTSICRWRRAVLRPSIRVPSPVAWLPTPITLAVVARSLRAARHCKCSRLCVCSHLVHDHYYS